MAQVEWRCSYRIYRMVQEYLTTLDSLSPKSDDYKAIVEEVRSLPGFPHGYDEQRDEIVVTPQKEFYT